MPAIHSIQDFFYMLPIATLFIHTSQSFRGNGCTKCFRWQIATAVRHTENRKLESIPLVIQSGAKPFVPIFINKSRNDAFPFLNSSFSGKISLKFFFNSELSLMAQRLSRKKKHDKISFPILTKKGSYNNWGAIANTDQCLPFSLNLDISNTLFIPLKTT